MKMHYASIAMVTDYDSWKENEEVTVEKVMAQMKKNTVSTTKVLLEAVSRVMDADWTEETAKLTHLVNSSIF